MSKNPAAIDQEVDLIKENSIYFSEFSQMNDPMEGFYRPSNLLKKNADFDEITKQLMSKKSDIGIACFSETKENVLMWAHYASNFTGICISYSTSELKAGLSSQFNLVKLNYIDEPTLLFASHAKNVDDAATRILSQKRYNWSYEREWRALGPTQGKVCVGRSPAVKSIYLGARILPEHRKKILDATKRYQN